MVTLNGLEKYASPIEITKSETAIAKYFHASALLIRSTVMLLN